MFKPALGWRKRRKIIMSKSDGGKGSSPRPFSVSQDEYNKRWDAIFSRDLEEETTEEVEEEDPDGDALRCIRCGGVDTMYVAPNGIYRVCDQCGLAERILHDDPDY
jgi:thiamine biosynthesis protein ThiC